MAELGERIWLTSEPLYCTTVPLRFHENTNFRLSPPVSIPCNSLVWCTDGVVSLFSCSSKLPRRLVGAEPALDKLVGAEPAVDKGKRGLRARRLGGVEGAGL